METPGPRGSKGPTPDRICWKASKGASCIRFTPGAEEVCKWEMDGQPLPPPPAPPTLSPSWSPAWAGSTPTGRIKTEGEDLGRAFLVEGTARAQV